MDFNETDAYSNRTDDTEEALRYIEEALDILSLEGPGQRIDRVIEILTRVTMLLDRDYGFGEEDEYDPRRELDFNEVRVNAVPAGVDDD